MSLLCVSIFISRFNFAFVFFHYLLDFVSGQFISFVVNFVLTDASERVSLRVKQLRFLPYTSHEAFGQCI